MILFKKSLQVFPGVIVVAALLVYLFARGAPAQPKAFASPSRIDDDYRQLTELLSAGKNEPAIVKCKEMIATDPDFYIAYERIVTASKNAGALNEARTFFMQLSKRVPENPYSYYGLGLVEQENEEYPSAIKNFKQTIALQAGFIPAYLALVDAYLKNDQAAAAEQYFTSLVTSDSGNAAGYLALGYLHRKNREWEQALQFLDLTIERDPKIAETYHQKGHLYYSLSEYDQALNSLQIALNMVRKEPFAEHEGRLLGILGLTQWNLDQYEAALNSFRQAVDILLKTGDRTYEGVVLGNTGLVYMYQWNYPRALEYFQKAIQVHRETGYRIAEGLTLNNIGLIYLNSSNYQKSLDYFQQAWKIFRDTGYLRGEGIVLGNFGAAYAETGYHAEALDYYEKALKIRREMNNKRDEGIILVNMGIVYQRLQQYEKAAAYLEDALMIYKDTGQKVYQGILLNALGQVSMGQGKIDQARDYHQQALAMGNGLNFPRVTWEAYYGIGKTYQRQGNLEKALGYYRRAVEVLESTWRKLGLEELKSAFLGSKTDVYCSLIRLLYETDRETPGSDNQAQAFHYAERTKARAFLDLLTEAEIPITSGINPELMEREQSFSRLYDSLRTELQRESSTPSSEPQRMEQLKNRIAHVTAQWDNLKQTLKRENPRYAQLKYPELLTLHQVQNQLPDDQTVLLEYLVGDTVSFLWVVSPTEVQMFLLPGEYELRDKINLLRRATRKPNLGVFFNNVSNDLYACLLEPAEDFLKSFHKVLIVPDGVLNLLPFEMLVTSIREETNGGPRYFIQDHSIRYAPSATVLAHLFKPDSGKWSRELLALGDPFYSPSGQADIFIVENGSLLTGPFADTTLTSIQVERLPRTGNEVKQIRNLFSPGKADAFYREAATEEKLNTGNELLKYRRIHLATHGLLNEEKPQYSGLLLALDDDSREDGFLQVWEVFNLKINADLVVLSACRTGMGKLIRGEGIVGLSRAFLYAGTPSLVVSLWNVKDESTTRLMVKFYRNMVVKGMTKAEALREAKLDLIREGRFTSPLYWAPFILVGEG